jgi:hypothetical protein
MAFGIKEATGTQPWMVPHLFFALPADFGNKYQRVKTATGFGLVVYAGFGQRVVQFQVTTYLYQSKTYFPTGDSRATLSFETPFKWSPVPVNGVPHTCTGTLTGTGLHLNGVSKERVALLSPVGK